MQVRKVKQKADKHYLNSFEDRWGVINDNYRTFIHYLLKYRYTDNWDREVNEDYLPVSLETVKSKVPNNISHIVLIIIIKKTAPLTETSMG